MREPPYMDALRFDPAMHIYRINGEPIPNITFIIPSNYSHVNPAVLERARQRGHWVHKATELYDLKQWDALSALMAAHPVVEPYLDGWINFLRDYECEFEDYDVERRLYHPIDRYAGTGDRPRMYLCPPGAGQRRRLVTSEIKSIARMDLNVALQTSGQQRCENHRSRSLGIPETEGRWGIQLQSTGKYRAIEYTDKYHEKVFLAYNTTVQWELHLGKRKLRAAA